MNPRVIRLMKLAKFPYILSFIRFWDVYATRDDFTCPHIWSSACQRSEVQDALQTQRLGVCKSSDACAMDQALNVAQATFGYRTYSNF